MEELPETVELAVREISTAIFSRLKPYKPDKIADIDLHSKIDDLETILSFKEKPDPPERAYDRQERRDIRLLKALFTDNFTKKELIAKFKVSPRLLNRMIAQVQSGQTVTIGRKWKKRHPAIIEMKIVEVVKRFEVLNISAARIAETVRQELEYKNKLSAKYVGKILKKHNYRFQTVRMFRKPKEKRDPEEIHFHGKRMVEYLCGGGLPIFFDVVKFQIGDTCRRMWIHADDEHKTMADRDNRTGMKFDFMVSSIFGAGAISATICVNCDSSVFAYHLANTCSYLHKNFNKRFSFHGDQVNYHFRGVELIKEQLRKKKDKDGLKFMKACFVPNLKYYSMMNHIENGVFSPVKMRFYYSAITQQNFSFRKILELFENSFEKNQRLAKNYIRFLRKMVDSNKNVDEVAEDESGSSADTGQNGLGE